MSIYFDKMENPRFSKVEILRVLSKESSRKILFLEYFVFFREPHYILVELVFP
jgi:hypothetical protein